MTSHVELDRDLDQKVAVRIMQPQVNRALDMLQDAARANAPAVRVWVTMRDERVRTTHFHADGQAIPDNLRFVLDKPDHTGREQAKHPRDPGLTIANRINCRCDDPTIPDLLRQSIHRTDVHLVGNRVEGSVETRFPRAAESEAGSGEDAGAHFMLNALLEVATRMRGGQAR